MSVTGAPDWIEVSVAHVRRADDEPHPKHLMLLEESGGTRRLPIWIGPAEATAMTLWLESAEQPRPMTYSLTASILQAAGSPIREVRITALTRSVYYAAVIVDGPHGPREVDARPSDAVNLALVASVPIRIDSELLGEAQTARSADAMAYPTGTAELAAEALRHERERMQEFDPGKDQAPGAR